MKRLRLLLVLLSVLSMVGLVLAQEEDEEGVVEGEYIVDLGFRPEIDGFGFENYGGDLGTVSLTSAEVVRFFGEEAVCVDAADEEGFCELTPNAQVWMDSILEYMSGGHCEGMAVLSLIFYSEAYTPDEFEDVSYTSELSLDNEYLQREIGYWWTTQTLAPVRENSLLGAPSEIVQALVDGLETEYYTLFFFQPDFTDGHAVTPYAVIDNGDGTASIAIYDNNYPGEERYVYVDMENDTWMYDGSPNPDEPSFLYEGDASTGTIGLTPIYARYEELECPFCGDMGGFEEGDYSEVVINNWSGNFAETFADVEAYPIYNQRGLLSAVRLRVPSSYQFSLPAGSSEGNISVSVFRQGNVTRMTNVELTNDVSFEIEPTGVSYEGAENVEIQQAASTDGEDYLFTITNPGGIFSIELDEETGDFRLEGDPEFEMLLTTEIVNEDGSRELYEDQELLFDEDGSIILNPDEWDSEDDIEADMLDEEEDFDGEEGDIDAEEEGAADDEAMGEEGDGASDEDVDGGEEESVEGEESTDEELGGEEDAEGDEEAAP
jgi:hypothetical protein